MGKRTKHRIRKEHLYVFHLILVQRDPDPLSQDFVACFLGCSCCKSFLAWAERQLQKQPNRRANLQQSLATNGWDFGHIVSCTPFCDTFIIQITTTPRPVRQPDAVRDIGVCGGRATEQVTRPRQGLLQQQQPSPGQSELGKFFPTGCVHSFV